MKRYFIFVVLVFVMLLMQLILYNSDIESYGETSGQWSMSEKHQVISLLEKIEINTRKEHDQ